MTKLRFTKLMGKTFKDQNQIAEPGQRWGTFQDAEYWRKQDFLRRTPAQRLTWLCEMLSIAYRNGALKPFGQETDESESPHRTVRPRGITK